MRKAWLTGCFALAIAALTVTFGLAPGGLTIQSGPRGLQSVRYDGTELLADGETRVAALEFEGAAAPTNLAPASVAREQSGSTFTSTYPWGSIRTKWLASGEQISAEVLIRNTSSLAIRRLGLEVLQLRLPERPLEYDGNTPLLQHNLGQIPRVVLTASSLRVTASATDASGPIMMGFPWALDRPKSTVFPLRINTGREPMYPDSLPVIERPIASGATDVWRISLSFSGASTPLTAPFPDLLRGFRDRYPSNLEWSDRRPIGSLILATAATGWKTNPRGWLLNPSVDVFSAAGREQFRESILAWADNSVRVLKSMNAQGAITWDIEGEEFKHPTTYIGDPRLMNVLAPEMEAVADAYFRKFRDAGLRVGICIRPQTLRFTATPRGATQDRSSDLVRTLSDKIAWAKARWGATLFYIDSNGSSLWPTDVSVLQQVHRLHPDVLLIPEHENTAYFSVSAPYGELRQGVTSTPSDARSVYPGAFMVINTADGDINGNSASLIDSIRKGDILLFRGWWDDPANQKLRTLYRSAGKP